MNHLSSRIVDFYQINVICPNTNTYQRHNTRTYEEIGLYKNFRTFMPIKTKSRIFNA